MSLKRGNHHERIFFDDGGAALDRDWLGESRRRFGVEAGAYCQMPNHVHLILAPQDQRGLGLAMSRAHRLLGRLSQRPRATGRPCFFKRRLGALAMDDERLIAALRDVALKSPSGRGLAARRKTGRMRA